MLNDNIDNAAYLLQLLITGAVSGSLYAFAALSFVLAFKASAHLNLAATEMSALGAFVILALSGAGVPIWIAIPAGLLFGYLLGAGTQKFLIRPAEKRGEFAVILTAIALILIISSSIGLIWGTNAVAGVDPFGDTRTILADGPPRASISGADIGIVLSLVVIASVLGILLKTTSYGLAFRALVSNRESAGLVGISAKKLFIVGWGIATLVGTYGAVMVTASLGAVDFMMMVPLLIYGIAAATLGGFDSILGAVVGGIIVGFIVNVLPGLVTFVPGEMGFVVALLVILLALLVRPQGLFGHARLERV